MGTRTATRQKMLVSAVELLRERGAAAVTVDAVLARSNAPRGSVYHHFPGGRAEIITESLALAGDAISALIEHTTDDGAGVALRRFGKFWKQILRQSDYAAGCPVVSVAIGGSSEDRHLQADAAQIFKRWHDALVGAISSEGVDAARARRLATTVIAAIEGAVILCRSQRSTRPLDETLTELELLLTSAMP
jgi:TetR/AcrR family transcriptional regulator, lmrAB and yxaGH operons repressor